MIISEKNIKIQVIQYLLAKKIHNIVVPEVTVGHKSLIHKQVRADIFAINGEISIYEIKSEKDTLSRLKTQLESYKQYANKVNVVIAEKFLDKLEIEDDVGIYVITNKGIKKIKKATHNKIKKDYILEYWLSNELKDFLWGYRGISKMDKKETISFMKELLNDTQLYNVTLYMLKKRYEKESNQIKDLINNQSMEFPKRGMKRNNNITPLKELPFGILMP
ncbi:MAG: sce7726 family protein [Sulfurovum sp.]|nr:sce7726 family protein [Sulfurovum sp.]